MATGSRLVWFDFVSTRLPTVGHHDSIDVERALCMREDWHVMYMPCQAQNINTVSRGFKWGALMKSLTSGVRFGDHDKECI